MHSIYRLLSPSLFLLSYLVFKILGLAPFTIKMNSNHQLLPIFEYSCTGVFYNVLLIIVFPILILNSMNDSKDVDYNNKSTTTEILEMAKSSVHAIVLLMVWLTIIINQKRAVNIVNTWRRTDKTLRQG